jgi:hypothetical protein
LETVKQIDAIFELRCAKSMARMRLHAMLQGGVRTAVLKFATEAAGQAGCGCCKNRSLCSYCGCREDLEIYTVEIYRKVRPACADGLTKRAAARHFNQERHCR